jgi:hypothetical protein
LRIFVPIELQELAVSQRAANGVYKLALKLVIVNMMA